MSFESDLIWEYEKMISQIADELCVKIVNKSIRHFQNLTKKDGYCLSGDADCLVNAWDEICVDAQTDTFFHEIYLKAIEQYIYSEVIPTLSEREKTIIWLQTNDYTNWMEHTEEEYNDNTGKIVFSNGLDIYSITDYLVNCIEEKAGEYSNVRIEKSLCLEDE